MAIGLTCPGESRDLGMPTSLEAQRRSRASGGRVPREHRYALVICEYFHWPTEAISVEEGEGSEDCEHLLFEGAIVAVR